MIPAEVFLPGLTLFQKARSCSECKASNLSVCVKANFLLQKKNCKPFQQPKSGSRYCKLCDNIANSNTNDYMIKCYCCT